jgi:hypothetical protein
MASNSPRVIVNKSIYGSLESWTLRSSAIHPRNIPEAYARPSRVVKRARLVLFSPEKKVFNPRIELLITPRDQN